jgi:DNA-binding NarL/FixJ family response regulator
MPTFGKKIRILLADDHAVVREGLKTLIQPQKDMVVVGEAGDGRSALKLANELKPDVIVIDVSMPDMNGATATQQIKQANSQIKVLALTVHEDRSYLERLLGAGASGYVLKRAAAAELLVQRLARQAALKERKMTDALTDRESAVAKLIAKGYTNKEIASQLEVSIKTIETHKARCMEKLGLRSRAELVQYALEQGWLKPG